MRSESTLVTVMGLGLGLFLLYVVMKNMPTNPLSIPLAGAVSSAS